MTRFTAFALAPLLLAACHAADDRDPAPAADGLEAVDTTTSEGALLAALLPVDASAARVADVAGVAAEEVPAYWSPPGCASASRVGATVTYQLDHCRGPWGLLEVTGAVDVTYETIGDAVHAEADAVDLVINGATLDLSADVIRSRLGAVVEVGITAHSEGVGARGTSFVRDGDYTLGLQGSDCWALDGDWSTSLGGRSWTTTVRDYARCAATCPEAGATITFAGASGSLTISFDGSDVASWSSTDQGGDLALACGGA